MAQGRAIVNLLELQEGQKVVAIVPVENFEEDASIFIVSLQGYMKKCRLSEYKNPRRGGVATMGLEEGDHVMAAKYVKRNQEVVLCTRNGMAVRIEESVVRDMGRGARGVNGPNLEDGDSIVSVVVGQPGDFLLTVCEKGVGKRSQIDEYRKTSTQRAKGVINVKITEKNGPVVAVIAVSDGDEIMLMAEKGKVIRTKMEDVRQTGRAAIGVYMMELDDDDKIVTVAKIAAEDAKDAHEQAAALKAEAQDEKLRESGIIKKADLEKQPETSAPLPASSEPIKPGVNLQEMINRAEGEEKAKSDEAEEKGDEPEAK